MVAGVVVVTLRWLMACCLANWLAVAVWLAGWLALAAGDSGGGGSGGGCGVAPCDAIRRQ